MMEGRGGVLLSNEIPEISTTLLLPSHFETSIFTFKGKISLNRVILDSRTLKEWGFNIMSLYKSFFWSEKSNTRLQ